MKNLEIARHIDDESRKASQEMAEVLGEPEWCKGYGVRNTHRIAIAPTKSTANLMGGVSEGINPDPAMVFTASGAAGEMDRIVPELLKIMKSRGVYNKQTVADVADKQGSVQHVDWLDEHEKAVFKTAFEMDMGAVLRMAATRGKFIDQWQSVNLFFSAEEDEAKIAQIHQQAFLDENILALYYVYSKVGVQAAKGECIACQ
jgi:ribonucleoside-diphosphate reductase alpha chain